MLSFDSGGVAIAQRINHIFAPNDDSLIEDLLKFKR